MYIHVYRITYFSLLLYLFSAKTNLDLAKDMRQLLLHNIISSFSELFYLLSRNIVLQM